MLKYLIFFLFTSTVFLYGCNNNAKTNNIIISHIAVKTNVVKPNNVNVQLTDSAKLLKHLDSLPRATFPCSVSDWNGGASNINLAEFKTKTLFKLSYKRIPRVIGGAGIDERIDSTFNLCDTNYNANWFLVVKTPKFFVVEVNDNYLLLVTIDYNLNVIEAIHIAAFDPSSNNHFNGKLASTIHKNLKIVMHYAHYAQGSKEDNYRKENEINEDDIWRINESGHFKAIRYRPNGVTDF